ncbi:hypothetical protein PVAP13_2NG325400 [Panicum virgatum]|uniref:Uncharacterized protein n=1 Tax=Panicum virgatum TaxID=38727 RepID=A0A8T0VK99_PANVG|nr:hypothetical protein PVAP13_2NG325400 [Panicum virgatum]
MFRESFDPEAHRSNREFDPSGVGLMRCCRVVPPTSSQVQLVDDLFEHEEEDVDEAHTGRPAVGGSFWSCKNRSCLATDGEEDQRELLQRAGMNQRGRAGPGHQLFGCGLGGLEPLQPSGRGWSCRAGRWAQSSQGPCWLWGLHAAASSFGAPRDPTKRRAHACRGGSAGFTPAVSSSLSVAASSATVWQQQVSFYSKFLF